MTVRITYLSNYSGPEHFAQGRATPGSAGVDLYAASDITLMPGERTLVPTGIRLAMPEGMEAQVRARSGRSLKEGSIVCNGPGTVDPDYRGEVGVIIQNNNPTIPAHLIPVICTEDVTRELNEYLRARSVYINKGEKIAQLIFAQYLTPEIIEVAEMESTVRGTGGFGSTDLPSVTHVILN
jgi:dUTP pyrophosphatase